MRVVLDTNILVRAAGSSDSPAREVFLRLLERPHSIIASRPLLDELRRVMNYPRVQQIHGLSPEEIEQHVHDIETSSELVDLPEEIPFRVQSDPDDDPIVATAAFGGAEVVCSRDQHLHQSSVAVYCAQFNIRVLSDIELLDELRALDS